MDPEFAGAVRQRLPAWRYVVQTAVGLGIPAPAFSASLAYYDSYRSPRLPANLIQAQRDFFGAHTYRAHRHGRTFPLGLGLNRAAYEALADRLRAHLVLGGAWLWGSRPLAEPAAALAAGPAVGRPAPDFPCPRWRRHIHAERASAAKPVVLNFWATWCQPCQRELPALQQAAEHFGDGVVIVGVDQGETAEDRPALCRQVGTDLHHPHGWPAGSCDRYNIQGLPTTYFIDARRRHPVVWMGEMNSVTLAEKIAGIVP